MGKAGLILSSLLLLISPVYADMLLCNGAIQGEGIYNRYEFEGNGYHRVRDQFTLKTGEVIYFSFASCQVMTGEGKKEETK